MVPVPPQTGGIRRSGAADQDMALDLEPAEEQEISSALCVAEHPGVAVAAIVLVPVVGFTPRVGLARVFALHVAQFPCHHPVVQATEGCGRYTDADIVGPAPD